MIFWQAWLRFVDALKLGLSFWPFSVRTPLVLAKVNAALITAATPGEILSAVALCLRGQEAVSLHLFYIDLDDTGSLAKVVLAASWAEGVYSAPGDSLGAVELPLSVKSDKKHDTVIFIEDIQSQKETVPPGSIFSHVRSVALIKLYQVGGDNHWQTRRVRDAIQIAQRETLFPRIGLPVAGVNRQADAAVEEGAKLFMIRRRCAGRLARIRVKPALGLPAIREPRRQSAHQISRIHPATHRKERRAPQLRVGVGQHARFVPDGFGGDEAGFLLRAHRPAPDRQVRPIIHLIKIDRVLFVFLAAHFAGKPLVKLIPELQ